jgi:hypothetical protein
MMTNNRTLTHSFDDLPLIVDGAFEDQGVSGEAEISYWPDGEWSIKSISIEVSRYKNAAEMEATGITSRYGRKQHVLDAGSPLYLILYERLEADKRGYVQNAVREQISEDREDAAEYRAELRRDDRMMAGL